MKRIIAATIMLVALVASACSGLTEAERHNAAATLDSLRKAGEQGDTLAQTLLGVIYGESVSIEKAAETMSSEKASLLRSLFSGGDVTLEILQSYAGQDYAEATRWFRKAAEQGVDVAQYSLGYMYANGFGVTQDFTEAGRWFRKAAEQGIDVAQYSLGYMYANGIGVPQDYSEAGRWIHKAAEQGLVMAQRELGTLYATGQGVRRDYVEAYKFLSLAAMQGDKNASRARALIGAMNMTPAQVAEAQRLAREWMATHGKKW